MKILALICSYTLNTSNAWPRNEGQRYSTAWRTCTDRCVTVLYPCLLLSNFVLLDESQPVKLVMQALPGIEQFVSQQLKQYPLV
jgi:hypothetical protein